MKKILLGTTAVVALATMSTEAFAAEKIKLQLGGFMRHYVGVTNSDEVAPTTNTSTTRAMDLSQWSNTEVYFKGDTTLDNGLKVAATVQLEADGGNTTDNIDRSYLTVSSPAMGALTIGADGHAGDDFRIGAPNANGNFDFGDFAAWAGVSTAAGTNTTGTTAKANDITDMGGTEAKLKYVSPTLGEMVTVFASYSAAEGAGNDAHNARNLTRNAADDGHTIGASLSGEFSGASVEAALISAQLGNLDVINVGLNVGMAGFTVGGAYSDFNDNRTGSNVLDGDAYELGVAYETGPYAVSARYMNSNNKGTVATVGDNEDTIWSVAATYDLGAGVALTAMYFDQNFDAEGAAALAEETSGVIAGIEVGF